ncbi:MAG: hypothetical protein AB3N11_16880 [Arenibacterium sp.]
MTKVAGNYDQLFDNLQHKCRWSQAFVVCMAVFLIATAPGLVADGRTADDWRQIHGAPYGGMPLNWTTEEGRWAMELIFVHVFGERFMPGLQAGLAALLLFLVARICARASVKEELQPLGSVFVFALGVHHLYMVNVLNFSSHVFAYPLALLLSLGAFQLFWQCNGSDWKKSLVLVLLGAQAIAFCAAIYQPFAPFGAVLLLVAFMRVDKITNAQLVRYTLVSIVGVVLAGVLYVAETQLAAALYPRPPAIDRVQIASASGLMLKLTDIPMQFLRVWAGTLQFIPTWLKWLNVAFFAFTSLLVIWAAVAATGRSGPRWLTSARVLLGAAGISVLIPLFIWLSSESSYFPPRVIAFSGILWAVLFLAPAGLLLNRFKPRLALLVFPSAFAAVHVMVAAAAWNDQIEMGTRDRALAAQIMARVSNVEGYDGGPFRIVGGTAYPDLEWGDFIGWTSFHPGNPVIGIFKSLFNVPWYAESGLLDGPQACAGFPAYDSVYTHDEIVYVCLSATDGFSDESCVDSGNDEIGRICFTRTAVIRFRDACDASARNYSVVVSDMAAADRMTTFNGIDSPGHALEGGCFFTAEWNGPAPTSIAVSYVDGDGAITWSEELLVEGP